MNNSQKYLTLQIATALAFVVCIPRIIFEFALNKGYNDNLDGIVDFSIQFFFSFLFAFIILWFNQKSTLNPWKKIFVSVFLFLFLSVATIQYNIRVLELTETYREIRFGYIFRNMFILVASILILHILNGIKKNQILTLQNKSLETENLQAQLSSLRQQLNPHFLFNSLNSLQSLIREDPEKSQLFVQNLSTVLRHSLDFQKKDLVDIKEELALLKAYVYLLKIRFGDNLFVKFENVDATLGKIPPLAIQLLIENAVNHNEISKIKALEIRIVSNNNNSTISIVNNLNPKRQKSTGLGLGLLNLKNRYDLLSNKNIEINQNENEFKVELPLL